MSRLVEEAGNALYAGWLSQFHAQCGFTRGQRWVGGRRVRWFLLRGGLVVFHRPADKKCDPGFYRVAIDRTPMPCRDRRAGRSRAGTPQRLNHPLEAGGPGFDTFPGRGLRGDRRVRPGAPGLTRRPLTRSHCPGRGRGHAVGPHARVGYHRPLPNRTPRGTARVGRRTARPSSLPPAASVH